LRAVRALHDPVWTADGYVSDKWRPVSPVSGRLDAFQWQTPVASLPSDKNATIESSPFEEAMLAPPARPAPPLPPAEPMAKTSEAPAEPTREPPPETAPQPAAIPAAQDNSPAAIEPAPATPTKPSQASESAHLAAAPLFRARADLSKAGAAPIPAVIPIVRAPDDPGVDEEAPADEFAEQIGPKAQAGGWRGFLSRWGA
jgi:HemY protein